MKTTLNLLAAGMILAALETGFAQPAITQQPQPCTNAVGTTATFWIVATGTGPLAHQWQKLSVTWSDLAGFTSTNLVVTNIQTSHAGDYRVVITNSDGAVTSELATLTVVLPPAILTHPNDRVVIAGANTSFSVSASGTWLRYQWRRDGADLPGATNAVLTLRNNQSTNAGAYAALVSNLAGAVTSQLAQLSVGQTGLQTNAQGRRLPYRLFLPPNYDPATNYPMVLFWHGAGGMGTDNQGQLIDTTAQYVFLNATNMARHPCFFLAPQIPAPSGTYDPMTYWLVYHDLAAELLGRLQSEFSIDPERLYVTGLSMGGMVSWAMLARFPDLFAAGVPVCGSWYFTDIWQQYLLIRSPVWNFHAADDGTVAVVYSDNAILQLRRVGQNPIYTRYASGGHGSWTPAYGTPGLVDWVMAQRGGVTPTNEPLLSISNPTLQAVLPTGATNLNLAGSAAALGRDVIRVTWTNYANNAKGLASGTNVWSAANIPLVANKTNVIAVVATTTSWAPALGGNTTFNDTLTVIQSPLRTTLTLQDTNAVLNWTGGGPPFRVQRATDLAAGDWTDFLNNARPPVPLALTGQAGFYRILGQ